jgi:hypothetical protein
MADALLAQSALDRLQSTAHELVVEGESYRRRHKPGRPAASRERAVDAQRHRSHHHRAATEHRHNPVPTSWRNPGPIPVASDTPGRALARQPSHFPVREPVQGVTSRGRIDQLPAWKYGSVNHRDVKRGHDT